jgi:hypothetical protein
VVASHASQCAIERDFQQWKLLDIHGDLLPLDACKGRSDTFAHVSIASAEVLDHDLEVFTPPLERLESVA